MLNFANAKINIGLNILSKRSDNFHDIETIFYPIGWSDIIEIIEKPDFGEIEFSSSGIEIPGSPEDNLIVKAYNLIKKDYQVQSVKVHLHKVIPIGAGLGGGSSDAAHFIKLLNEKFDLGLSWGEMHHYARQLGSDCSFFIANKPVIAEQKGDVFESVNLSLKGYHVVVVYPEIHINTAETYSHIKPHKPAFPLEQVVLNQSIDNWKNYVGNDFETFVFEKFPEIKKIKEELYDLGAVYSSMSGSGSSVYGLFHEKPVLNNIFEKFLIWEEKL